MALSPTAIWVFHGLPSEQQNSMEMHGSTIEKLQITRNMQNNKHLL
jgi:hypothetical protein